MIYLHIGTLKTGTTSLRHFIASNKPFLLNNKIYVPDFLGFNHKELTLFASEQDNIARLRYEYNLLADDQYSLFKKQFSDRFVEKIKPYYLQDYTILLTNENLSLKLTLETELLALYNLLKKICPTIKIVVYLREQTQYLISHYSTHVKNGYTKSFSIWLKEFSPSYLDYYQFLQLWSKVFGKDNIIIKLCEPKKSTYSDTVNIFLETLGVNVHGLPTANTIYNLSLNKSCLTFLQTYNKIFMPTIEYLPTQEQQSLTRILETISLGEKFKMSNRRARFLTEKFDLINKKVAIDFLHKKDGVLFMKSGHQEKLKNNFSFVDVEQIVNIGAQLWRKTVLQQEEQLSKVRTELEFLKSLNLYKLLNFINKIYKKLTLKCRLIFKSAIK